MSTEFVSKPQYVEAIQWTGHNGRELIAAFDGKVTIESWRPADEGEEEWHCGLLAGKDGAQQWVPVPVGHWLVHPVGDFSDIWPVEDSYFQEKYGAADVRRGDYAIGSTVWPGLSKVLEEIHELGIVLSKIVGASGSTEYWGGIDLRENLIEELGDVLGVIKYFTQHNLTVEERDVMHDRSFEKRDRFNDWHINGHDPKTRTR